MKPETLDNYVTTWGPFLMDDAKDKGTAAMERTLRLLIKEVERDTRHAACDEINKLNNAVHNLRF